VTYAAHLHVPEHAVGNYGEDVAQFSAELLGRPLDAAQREAVGALTSYDKRGRWAALEGAVLMARQNGKTAGTITPVVLWDLFTNPRADRIAWSAHLFRTTRDAFRDHLNMIDGSDWLSRKLRRVNRGTGNESIELVSGRLVDYLARSKGGGRGIGGELIVVDETLLGWSGTEAAALLPILAARSITGNPMVLYASSGALAGEDSDYLRTLVKRGRSGTDTSLTWVEHCAPGSWDDPGCLAGKDCSHVYGVAVGCALDNEALRPHANPAYGVRISAEILQDMRQSMPPLDYGREFLGWHQKPAGAGASPISADDWDELGEVGSVLADARPAFCCQVGADNRSACIVVAGRRADGRWHVEVIEDRSGTEWVPEALQGLLRRHSEALVVLMSAGTTGQLVPELLQRGVQVGAAGQDDGHRVELLTLAQLAAACPLLESYVAARKLVHPKTAAGEPDPRWRASLEGARSQAHGRDGWVWSLRDSTIDPMFLTGTALALYAAVRREDWTGYDPLAGFG
jgi:hypothetical protein